MRQMRPLHKLAELAVLEIIGVLYYPFATMLNFNRFHLLSFECQNPNKYLLCGLLKGTSKTFGWKRINTIRKVASGKSNYF